MSCDCSNNCNCALFGNGSDGDIVISTASQLTDGYINANTFTIDVGASVQIPPRSSFIVRASKHIVINGDLIGNGILDATTTGRSFLIGSTVGGAGGGGGGGGGDSDNPFSTGIDGSAGNVALSSSGLGFGNGTLGSLGIGGIGSDQTSDGTDGYDGSSGTAGVDTDNLTHHLALYPSGGGGIIRGAVAGVNGSNGGDGGAASLGSVAGGLGGRGGNNFMAGKGNGGASILLVSPLIILNGLVSANGATGANAPPFGNIAGPTAGDDAPGGSGFGGGGGGGGGGGAAGGAGGVVLLFYGQLIENTTPQASGGAGGTGADGAAGGLGDGTGTLGGTGGKGADGATGSPGYVIRQKIICES